MKKLLSLIINLFQKRDQDPGAKRYIVKYLTRTGKKKKGYTYFIPNDADIKKEIKKCMAKKYPDAYILNAYKEYQEIILSLG